MANKQLTATVRLNTKQAEQKLKQISRAIDIMNRSVGKTSNTYNQVDAALKNSTTRTKQAQAATDKWANSAKKVNTNFKQGESTLARMSRSLRNMLAAYVGVMGTRFVLETSDTVTSAENRLNALNGNNPQLTQESMDKIYAASMRSRSGYNAMLDNVGKSMTLAGGSFGNNIDNAIRFQEIMSKAYTVGGASAAEQASSMYQLIQALGSGVLQGDELRSVREGAPLAYKAIEQFAQGVLDTDESLKELASQGKITSDMVVAAIMDMENGVDNINTKFEKTKITFAQAGKMIGNMALQAFRPVLQKLNDALNTEIGQKMLESIGNVFILLSNTLQLIIDKIGSVIKWIADNWDWLKYVLIAGLAMLTAYFVNEVAVSIINAIGKIKWKMMGILLVIGLLVAGIFWLANNTSSGCEFIVSALLLVAIAIMLIGLITNSTALMILGIVLLVVAGIVAVVAYCGGEIMGVIYAFGAVCQNVGAFIGNVFAACCNWIATLFANVWNNVAGNFWDFIADLMDGLDWLSKPLEAIAELFGKSFDYENFVAEIRHKADGYNEQFDLNEAWKTGMNTFEYKDIGEAYDKGYKKGNEWGNAIDEFGNSLKEKLSNFGAGKYEGLFDGSSYLPDPYSNEYSLDKYLGNLDDINANTSDIADSMDLRDDDLDFLRKIAEMEWRNEFTTAEIHIDMTNHNTVNGERDLDGIVEYLSEALRAEMVEVAYGNHL